MHDMYIAAGHRHCPPKAFKQAVAQTFHLGYEKFHQAQTSESRHGDFIKMRLPV